jgi:hypothetical protein
MDNITDPDIIDDGKIYHPFIILFLIALIILGNIWLSDSKKYQATEKETMNKYTPKGNAVVLSKESN